MLIDFGYFPRSDRPGKTICDRDLFLQGHRLLGNLGMSVFTPDFTAAGGSACWPLPARLGLSS